MTTQAVKITPHIKERLHRYMPLGHLSGLVDALLELTKIKRKDGGEWSYASGGTTSSMDEGGRDLCCQAVK